MNKKLKPVIFVQGDRNFYRNNAYAQNLLLKAMTKGITDPVELKKIAGLSSVAEVYRTLDKMAIRREYHRALGDAGLSLDVIVGELKSIIDTSSSAIKLKGIQTLLKSLGLDKYEESDAGGKTWEEVLLKMVEDSKNSVNKEKVIENVEYEVIEPPIPEEEKRAIEKEREFGKQLYEGNR